MLLSLMNEKYCKIVKSPTVMTNSILAHLNNRKKATQYSKVCPQVAIINKTQKINHKQIAFWKINPPSQMSKMKAIINGNPMAASSTAQIYKIRKNLTIHTHSV
jgi:hypothetical protein